MNCILCGKENSEFIGSHADVGSIIYDMYKCHRCLLEFSQPMKAQSAEAYQFDSSDGYYSERWEFKKAASIIGRGKKIFDFGCGDGRFMKLVFKNGNTVTGIEINRFAIERIKQLMPGVSVHSCKIEDFIVKYPEEKFDVFCAFHIVEHLENPVDFLLSAKEMMNNGGLLIMALPNCRRQSLFYSDREYWDKPPHHLTRWEYKSIRVLMASTGFDILNILDEPITIKSTVEAMMKRFGFGFTGKKTAEDFSVLSKSLIKSDKNLYRKYKLFSGIKRSVFYVFAPIFFILDSCRALTGRNMLIVAKKEKNRCAG